MLLDFPGRHRLEWWLITRRGVLSAVNSLRGKLGHPPLVIEKPEAGGGLGA